MNLVDGGGEGGCFSRFLSLLWKVLVTYLLILPYLVGIRNMSWRLMSVKGPALV